MLLSAILAKRCASAVCLRAQVLATQQPVHTFGTGGANKLDPEVADYVLDPLRQLFAKKLRKLSLENTLLQPYKTVLPIKRLRQESDGLIKLKKNKESPGSILQRDQFPEINFVVDTAQVFAVRRQKHHVNQPFYLKFSDQEEIRCTLEEIYLHPVENWPLGFYWRRYIVGQPNRLRLPIEFRPSLSNVHLNRGSDFQQKIKEVEIICYNDVYPAKFEIPLENLTAQRGYKLGDLQNALPQGIYLDKRYNLNMTILELSGDRLVRMEQEQRREKLLGQDLTKSNTEKLSLSSGSKEKKARKVTKVRSLKKLVQGMSQEEKEKLIRDAK